MGRLRWAAHAKPQMQTEAGHEYLMACHGPVEASTKQGPDRAPDKVKHTAQPQSWRAAGQDAKTAGIGSFVAHPDGQCLRSTTANLWCMWLGLWSIRTGMPECCMRLTSEPGAFTCHMAGHSNSGPWWQDR